MALPDPKDFDAAKLTPHEGKAASTHVPDLTRSAPYQPDSLEFSAPLETSVSLEAPRPISHVPLKSSIAVSPELPLVTQLDDEKSTREPVSNVHNSIERERPEFNAVAQPLKAVIGSQTAASTQISDEATVSLLEERLVIDRHRRKVGEVVVRKEIETYIVEVPVRREKLIIEQVSPTYEQLAVVDLGQTQPQDISSDASLSPAVSAKFTSATAAIEFLEAIAADAHSGITMVQVSVVSTDEKLQTAHQQWLKQHLT